MGRTKPKTRLRKLAILGPRTGTHYVAEELPGIGLVVVHGPGGTVGLFQRKDEQPAHLVLQRFSGDKTVAAAMKRDIEP